MPAQCSRQPSFAWLWLEHSVRTLANLSGLRRFVVQIRHVRTDRPGRTMTAATATYVAAASKGRGRACNATLWSSRYNCTTAKLHYRSRESRGKFGRLGLFPPGVSPRFCRFGHKRAYRVPVSSRALASHDGGFDRNRSWFQCDAISNWVTKNVQAVISR